jgi:UTP--glucose-1-phosphate uridylyltransferase
MYVFLQSDLYSTSEGVLVRNTAQANPANPSIELGPEFEKVTIIVARLLLYLYVTST